MNKYAGEIRARWESLAPKRTAAIENADEFFERLGEQALTTVTDLLPAIAGPDGENEGYLDKVRRLRSSMILAEEIAMADVEWPTPELTPDEERHEWEMNQSPHDVLANWALRADGPPIDWELRELSDQWMLPEQFFIGLLEADSPWAYLNACSEQLRESADRRFARYLRQQ